MLTMMDHLGLAAGADQPDDFAIQEVKRDYFSIFNSVLFPQAFDPVGIDRDVDDEFAFCLLFSIKPIGANR